MPKVVQPKKAWLKIGFMLFAKGGIKSIVVENMAKHLACNKSSFYWHFKSKSLFVSEVVQYWMNEGTANIIEECNKESNGADKLRKLLSIAFKKDPHVDFIFYLKKYALVEKQYQALIDQVDNDRMAYVKEVLVEMGYKKSRAAVKAGILYNYLIGYHEMIKCKDQDKDYVKSVIADVSHFINFKKINK